MTTTDDRTNEIRDKIDTTRTQIEANHLRRLPALAQNAPADLISAFQAYDRARDDYHAADTDVLAAEALVENAVAFESAAIAAAVRAGTDFAGILDHGVEAQRELRRAATVLLVRANDLKAATGHLLGVVGRHKAAQRAVAQPAVDQAGAELQDALSAVSRARTRLAVTADAAAWWDTVAPNHFPNLGNANREAVRQAMGKDYTVLDSAAAASLVATDTATGGLA